MIRKLALVSAAIALFSTVPVSAQNRETPYWASIRAEKLNMRVGPSGDYRVTWVYQRQGLPVKVLRIREGWRLVEDPDGAQGWVVARLLKPERGAIVTGEGLAAIRESGSAGAKLKWNAEPGVVGALGKCSSGWCEFNVQGHAGWIEQSRLWGVGEP